MAYGVRADKLITYGGLMETPVFRLEGIVKSKNEMSDFEGPLALILQLLSKDKIEIRDISISLILEQYLIFLGEMEELDLDIASEFVAMASHLAFIKTKMLLSGGEEVSELDELISSLEELRRGDVYLQIKEVAQVLSGMYSRDGALLAGPPEYLPPETEYKYLHVSDDLIGAIYKIIGRENIRLGSMNPREVTYPRRIVFSLPEKISEILDILKRGGETSLASLFYASRSRTEMIATLVAVLELCRVGSVQLTGSEDDVKIAYIGAGREPLADFTEME